MPRSNQMEENAAMFQSLADSEGSLQGPVDLMHNTAAPLLLAPLVWKNWGSNGKLKITNTNSTAVVTGHWKGGRPSVIGGPFTVPYLLGQIHFHWGQKDSVGSEHTLDGRRFPLEMHVLLYKSVYDRPKIALKERDGVSVLVYFFEVSKVQERSSESLQLIIDGITEIHTPYKSTYVSPNVVNTAIPFTEGYFLYWGSVMTDHCAHVVSWLVCPQPLPASSAQVAEFRKMMNSDRRNILKNYCDTQPLFGRKIFIATTDARRDSGLSRRNRSIAQVVRPKPASRDASWCCLSPHRKRLMSRKRTNSFTDIVCSLNSLETQTSLKLEELEALSKQLVARDREEGDAWFTTMERKIHNLELRAALESIKGGVTPENFKRWHLKAVLFREVSQGVRHPLPSRCRKQKGIDNETTFYVKNLQFRENLSESADSAEKVKVHGCRKDNRCTVKMSEKHETTLQKTSLFAERSLSQDPEFGDSQKPNEVADKSEVPTKSVGEVISENEDTSSKLNFVQRNKCLAGEYNKRRSQGNSQEKKVELGSDKPLLKVRRVGGEDAPCSKEASHFNRGARSGLVSKQRRVREGSRKTETSLTTETRQRVLNTLKELNEPLQSNNK